MLTAFIFRLKDELCAVTSREIEKRNNLRKLYPDMKRSLEFDEHREQQCFQCHAYVYLTSITCECTDRISCADHMDEVRSCQYASFRFEARFLLMV
jgi:histone demethylase JARID1